MSVAHWWRWCDEINNRRVGSRDTGWSGRGGSTSSSSGTSVLVVLLCSSIVAGDRGGLWGLGMAHESITICVEALTRKMFHFSLETIHIAA